MYSPMKVKDKQLRADMPVCPYRKTISLSIVNLDNHEILVELEFKAV